jgi:hypothetical protein
LSRNSVGCCCNHCSAIASVDSSDPKLGPIETPKKALKGLKFGSDDGFKVTAMQCFQQQPRVFFADGGQRVVYHRGACYSYFQLPLFILSEPSPNVFHLNKPRDRLPSVGTVPGLCVYECECSLCVCQHQWRVSSRSVSLYTYTARINMTEGLLFTFTLNPN